ncbi:YqgE/AlgH family protein [uncultured Desulfobulbus sp.]|jgi:putative transcriptional regulator|uniref:YqgE/AlgH family protein n=1 Tax=uncultured Desulfobulbus sp. TaxID=239745 RepID=UPI0029C65FD6|nr:YqgE/AlgH family protein [uncultured Desulfobulbus sp.]
MESLTGHFLISTPQMPDPRFQEQVIYLCAHNEEGAMGLVINNPNPEITLLDVLHGSNLAIPEGPLPPVYMGGPVELDAGFILHSTEAPDRYSLEVKPGVYLSRDSRLLEDISLGQGPKSFLFMLGYAGWGAGQLEGELVDNSWLTVPADLEVLFHTPDEQKWKKAAQKFGVDISIFGDIIGYA